MFSYVVVLVCRRTWCRRSSRVPMARVKQPGGSSSTNGWFQVSVLGWDHSSCPSCARCVCFLLPAVFTVTAGGTAEPTGSLELVALACRCLAKYRKKRPAMKEVRGSRPHPPRLHETCILSVQLVQFHSLSPEFAGSVNPSDVVSVGPDLFRFIQYGLPPTLQLSGAPLGWSPEEILGFSPQYFFLRCFQFLRT